MENLIDNMEIYRLITLFPDGDGDYVDYKIGNDDILHIAVSDQHGKIVQEGTSEYYRVLFIDHTMAVVSAFEFAAMWRNT